MDIAGLLQALTAADDGEEEGDKPEKRQRRGKAAAAARDTPFPEVNYALWSLRIWPKLRDKAPKELLDQSAAVFTEIFSFIRGSSAAMETEKGYLSEEQYCALPRKMSHFMMRPQVYSLFRQYEQQKQKLGL